MSNNMVTYYFLRKGEPKQGEPVNKYSHIFSNLGVDGIITITYDKIRIGDHPIILPEVIGESRNIVLLIPSILDTFNSMTYDGVEYAMRIYFKYVSMRKENFRIVILGSEDESAFWMHCKYSNILKCPHVEYTYNNAFSIKESLKKIAQKSSDEWIMKWSVCFEAIKRLNIEPPASYKSHHSITNEWSIYRWSKFVGIKDVNIQKEIDDFLYFNYLKAIYSESDIPSNCDIIKKVEPNGRVLLIDDEAGKGWTRFFESLCEQSTFESIGSDFKKMTRQEIIGSVEQTVLSFDPDVVILDLRLTDDDYDVKDPLKLSGTEVFNKIKKINKGIQIVIFSASNKVWNYLPLSYDGVVIKESPEQSSLENHTVECVEKMVTSIDQGIRRGRWLKKIYVQINKISDLISQSSLFQDKEKEVLSNLVVAFDLLSKNDYNVNAKYLAYSYLQLYIIVEKFLQEDSIFRVSNNEAIIFNKYIVARWGNIGKSNICDYAINDGPKYKIGLNLHDSGKDWWKETHFKMSAVLLFGYGVKDVGKHPWSQINYVRNHKAGHPETSDIACSEYETLLDFMIYIFDNKKRRYVSIDHSLPQIKKAIVTANTSIYQAKLKDSVDTQNYSLAFTGNKVKLKLNEEIRVEVLLKKDKISELIFIEKCNV